MQEVIDQLALDTIPFLLAVEKEIEILDSLLLIKNVQYGGKLKLQQELQLISNLGVMLMDSGMHIAAMLGASRQAHPFVGFLPLINLMKMH
jgi:hypothetical protein